MDTETALKHRRKQIQNDNDNFSSKKVLNNFVQDKYEMTFMIAAMNSTKNSKIWKPDKFSFGKKKGGKGEGLASIVELV